MLDFLRLALGAATVTSTTSLTNTLCGEYNVKNINASGRETLADASFRALVDAVKQSGANHTSICRPLNEIGRRNLLMQLAYKAPKHLRIHCDVESAVSSIWFDCFINDARCSEIPNIFLTGNDFDSAAGILALWDELDKNWIVSWKKNTRCDESEQCVCEGCEISLIERVDAGNVFKKYTVWSTTRSEAIVRAAVAAWSD